MRRSATRRSSVSPGCPRPAPRQGGPRGRTTPRAPRSPPGALQLRSQRSRLRLRLRAPARLGISRVGPYRAL
eukprot:4279744-Lingulodinium_polyedra.AAC.1